VSPALQTAVPVNVAEARLADRTPVGSIPTLLVSANAAPPTIMKAAKAIAPPRAKSLLVTRIVNFSSFWFIFLDAPLYSGET
jgi:hypothetical protein